MIKTAWSTLATHPVDSGDVKDHPYQPQFQAFVDATRAGKKMPLTDFETALESHRVVFAADLSAARGRPVKLAELEVADAERAGRDGPPRRHRDDVRGHADPARARRLGRPPGDDDRGRSRLDATRPRGDLPHPAPGGGGVGARHRRRLHLPWLQRSHHRVHGAGEAPRLGADSRDVRPISSSPTRPWTTWRTTRRPRASLAKPPSDRPSPTGRPDRRVQPGDGVGRRHRATRSRPSSTPIPST